MQSTSPRTASRARGLPVTRPTLPSGLSSATSDSSIFTALARRSNSARELPKSRSTKSNSQFGRSLSPWRCSRALPPLPSRLRRSASSPRHRSKRDQPAGLSQPPACGGSDVSSSPTSAVRLHNAHAVLRAGDGVQDRLAVHLDESLDLGARPPTVDVERSEER